VTEKEKITKPRDANTHVAQGATERVLCDTRVEAGVAELHPLEEETVVGELDKWVFSNYFYFSHYF
jgi:hypothetical protein